MAFYRFPSALQFESVKWNNKQMCVYLLTCILFIFLHYLLFHFISLRWSNFISKLMQLCDDEIFPVSVHKHFLRKEGISLGRRKRSRTRDVKYTHVYVFNARDKICAHDPHSNSIRAMVFMPLLRMKMHEAMV